MKQLYKLPTAQHRKLALGSLPGLPYRLRKSLQAIKDLSQPMSQPVQGEWLWQQQQQGQTFDAYKGQMHNEVDAKRNTIYIRPLEAIDPAFLRQLQDFCECFFHPMKVRIAKQLESLKGIATRINPHTEKKQFNARDVLSVLRQKLPPDAFCLLGVSVTDLYPKDEWNFVFGLASIRDRTGVFSFARYDERFFSDLKYETDYDLIRWRSAGVVAHEVTHMFGIRHCVFYRCLMNGSNHLEESSKKPMYLCVVCLRKLQSNIGFDVLDRYERLLKYYEEAADKRVKEKVEFLREAVARIRASVKV